MLEMSRQLIVTLFSATVMGVAIGSLLITDAEMRGRSRLEAVSRSCNFSQLRFWLLRVVVFSGGLAAALFILQAGEGPLRDEHRWFFVIVFFGAALAARYIRYLIWREK